MAFANLLVFLGLLNARKYYQSMWHAGDMQCSRLNRLGGAGVGGKYMCMDSLRDHEIVSGKAWRMIRADMTNERFADGRHFDADGVKKVYTTIATSLA